MLHEIGACPPVTPAKPYSAALCKALGALHVKGAALTPAAAAALRIAAAKAEHAVQGESPREQCGARHAMLMCAASQTHADGCRIAGAYCIAGVRCIANAS